MARPINKIEFTKEWLDKFPKTINPNGCWIPILKPESTGYVRISSNHQRYELHRLSMCIIYNIDYNNKKIVTRHSKDCDNACFFYGHLQPGSDSDNIKDQVRDGTHRMLKKNR